MKRAGRGNVATLIVAVLFAAFVLVGVMFYSGAWRLGSSYNVTVFVPNAGSMGAGSTVRVAGLTVGRVSSIDRNGPNAVLGLRIDSGPHPLPTDSRVAVRLRSLVGESYVELYPGHAKATIPAGGSLPVSQANDFVDVDQILSVLRGTTKDRARQLIQGVGSAVGDKGPQLNQVLGSASSLIIDSVPLTSTLAGQHEQVGRLVQNLGDVMQAIGDRTSALSSFALGARQTFEAVASRDVALRSLLDQLPSTLSQVRQTSLLVQNVTPRLSPVLTNLGYALQALSPAIHLLGPAARSGIQLVRNLGSSALPLRGVLQGIEKLKSPSVAALPQVHATLCQLNPILQYAAPYGANISAFFANFGSAGNPYDAQSHTVRAMALATPAAVPSVLTPQLLEAQNLLRNIGLLGTLNKSGYNPFPKPGEGNHPSLGIHALGPADAGKVIKYPHVVADC
jgi:virulence factor Mce-like protein